MNTKLILTGVVIVMTSALITSTLVGTNEAMAFLNWCSFFGGCSVSTGTSGEQSNSQDSSCTSAGSIRLSCNNGAIQIQTN
ncbi:MAG TPA: hypothetical protein VFT71_00210 [Candidatus Nitrosocosmicus sp.]|nr:hypothetical protein [Candidatus Nitrosocosmicus sp.]